MYRRRQWSVRHARGLKAIYDAGERVLIFCAPLLRRIGLARLERPVAAVERTVKGFLFDCRMCGQCALSDTGLSCPMNCPKELRNGPCGGVRQDGGCEVIPEMPCVWVAAWEGSRRLAAAARIEIVQRPVDHRLANRSAWLRELASKSAVADAAGLPPQ